MKSGSPARQEANRASSKPVRVMRLRYTAGMIWSVSTALRRNGAPMPVCRMNLSTVVELLASMRPLPGPSSPVCLHLLRANPYRTVASGAAETGAIAGTVGISPESCAASGRGGRSPGADSAPRTAVAAATTGETRWVRPPFP